ncbi:MAG: hypothetical protein CL714_00190 [Chloroflexi bacterium]|nr:hypothetical protein [Chloroflexota bacterium]
MNLEIKISMQDEQFMAGSAKSVITPPVSFPIFSPEFKTRKSNGILDDLLCRVVVIDIFEKKIMFISLDIWGVSDYLLTKIRKLVSKKINISQQDIFISATGNATSPSINEDEKIYRNYYNYLPEQILSASYMATENLAPASIGSFATKLPNVSTFYEKENYPGNPALFVTEIIGKSKNTIAKIYNFSCPANIMGEQNHNWTADFPGYSSWALEQKYGGVSIFLPAPCSDIRPYNWWKTNPNFSHSSRQSTDVQAMGLLLATQVSNFSDEVFYKRNIITKTFEDEDNQLRILKLGDIFFVFSNKPQNNKFARRVRKKFLFSKIFVYSDNKNFTFDETISYDPKSVKKAQNILQKMGAN